MPFGYSYVDGREIQAELDITPVIGTTQTVTNLLSTTETKIANTILSSLSFNDATSQPTAPAASAAPLGEYRIETYRLNAQSQPDTRLVNLDGGERRVVIDSTRVRAGLAAGHGLMSLVFPAFGTTIYLQDVSLKNGSVGGDIWTYNTTTSRLTKQTTYPPVGWGKFVVNKIKTRAIYVSSTDSNDSGDIKTMYFIDLIKNELTSLLTLRDNQTFSAGWGGTGNRFVFQFKTDDVVTYTFYDQNSGNKQTKSGKTQLGTGQIVVPGADPALQKK
jgi:hypothetical protein